MKLLRICVFFAVLCALTYVSAYAQDISGQVRDASYGPENIKILDKVKVYEYGKPDNYTETDTEGKYTLKNAGEEGFLVFEKDGFVKSMKKINGETLDMSMVCNDLTTISDDAFFGEYINLDYPGLEKVKAAWESRDVLMAKYELIEYYRNRETPLWNVKPVPDDEWKPDTSFSLLQADEEYNHIYKGYDINTDEKTINWTADPYNDKEFMWEVNRMFAPLHMGKAYNATHDSKYAYEYQAMCIDWIKRNPKPMWKDNNNTWRTIEAGIRNHYPLPDSWFYTLFNEDITTESRITMLKSVAEHMEYLTAYTGTNNWLIFEGRGLYTLATLHPYFKNSQMWKDIGMNRIAAQLQNQFCPDGWHQEMTPNYHMESANSITEVEKIASLNNEKTSMSTQLRKAYAVENYVTFSNGRAMPLNDTVYGSDYRGLVRGRAQVVGSYETGEGEEYLLTSSDYRVGEQPKEASKAFDYAGLTVMRDYWGPENITVYFEGGPSGMGHGQQSRDKFQVLLSAYGRDMLIEGGCLDYTSRPIAKYFYTTTAHNAALVDGQDQIRRANGMLEPAENFVSYLTDGFDYTTGYYDETFGETTNIKVDQKRKVSFDKNGLVFVTDEFTGEGEHSITQNWNITQCDYKLNSTTGKFVGTYDDGTGFVMIPLDGYSLRADVVEGQETEPFRGIVAISSTVTSCEGLQYNIDKTDMPFNMNVMIVPFKGEEPDIKVQKEETEENLSCIQVKYGGEQIYYLTNHGSESNNYGKFVFDGETAIVRCDSVGNLIDVKKYPQESSLTYNGQEAVTGSINISTVNSGDIIKNSVTLKIDGVSGGTVKYYALINGETVNIASNDAASEYIWDISGLENAKDVQLWAEWTDGKETRKSTVLRDIEIANTIDVSSKISLADRRFAYENNTVTLYDGSALYASGAVCAKGDSVSGKIKSDKQALIKISARAYTGKDAVINVTVNGENKEITLTDTYSEYEVTTVPGDYEFKIENVSDNKVILNYLRNEGENINREDNKVFRSSLNIKEATCKVGNDDWQDYEMSAKLMVSNVYSKTGEGTVSLNGRDGTVRLRLNTVTDKIELVSNGAVIASLDLKLDENVWYNAKLKLSGTQISAKVWECGQEEPGQYSLTGTVSEVLTGAAGMTSSSIDVSADDIVITDNSGTIIYSHDMEDSLCGGFASGFSGSNIWAVGDRRMLR